MTQINENKPELRFIGRFFSELHTNDGDLPLLLNSDEIKVEDFSKNSSSLMILIGPDKKALVVWKQLESGNESALVNCILFTNKSKIESDILIKDALYVAGYRWPNAVFTVTINPKTIRFKKPLIAFLKAGWLKLGSDHSGRQKLQFFR